MKKEIAKKIACREEIPLEFTWNLGVMFRSAKVWDGEFQKTDGLLHDFLKFRGRIGESPDVFLAALQSNDALERTIEKLFVYAHLKSDQDTGDSKNLSRLERISARSAEIEGDTAWFIPEILALSEEKITEYLNCEVLALYRHSIKEVLRDRAHTLGAAEERILGLASDIFSTPHHVFSMLNDADMRFPSIKDENGNDTEVTHGNYGGFLESENREVRKSAFESVHNTYYDFRNTFAAILDGTVKTNIFDAKIRSYDSALSASLHDENIPVEIFDNVIGAVRSNLGLFHRSLKVRRKTLGLDKLEMYDLRCPLAPEYAKKYSWKEACEILMDSLEPLGEECRAIAAEALKKRWIDIYENRGKRSGAYSGGCYDSPPYILMNFNGTLGEVSTLAHEMGHSLNSHLTNIRQHYHYSDISIFLSEIASNVNEILMFNFIFENTSDEKFRFYLMDRFSDDFRTVVFRQTMFSEFEKKIYAQRESGEPLTHELLCEEYYNLNRKYHGTQVSPDRTVQSEWARIPHFHYGFYVFKYVTGFVAALRISELLRNDTGYRKRYMDFLAAGSSDDVIPILRNAGVDFSDTSVYDCCFQKFNEVLTFLENKKSK